MRIAVAIAFLALVLSACETVDRAPLPEASAPAATALASKPSTKSIRIASWNAREVFRPQDVTSRKKDWDAAAAELKPDVLILIEFTSCPLARRVADSMGLKSHHMACTDFIPSDAPSHAAFEVAVFSRWPIDEAVEFDQTPDGTDDSVEEERKLVAPKDVEIEHIGASRGFLFARIDSIQLTVTAVHLKSSQSAIGKKDAANAQKRELVAAAAVKNISERSKELAGYSHLIVGDFNVGHSDDRKNGVDLVEDCYSKCGDKDGYDETHALLWSGLVDGLKMKNLMFSTKTSTYPSYPGSPIDNIYVDGPGTFSYGRASTDTFGSDHLAVSTTYTPGIAF